MTDDSFVKYRVADNSIVVNTAHPFTEEHSHTKAEKELIRTIGMVSLLSDMFALEAGVAPETLESAGLPGPAHALQGSPATAVGNAHRFVAA